MSEMDMLRAMGPLARFLVDPNSTLGLRWEGARGRVAGKAVADNPYSSWCAGSLAEQHWWEGWWLEGQRSEGAATPDVAKATAFAKAQRALAVAAKPSPPSSERASSREDQ